ncbi:hypothetical protein NBRC116584_16520 [Hydrogenophaga sp. 5NK40-0174]
MAAGRAGDVESPDAWLRRLEWQALRPLQGWWQGEHRSLQRGRGLDLVDLRAYQPHDDVRHIDWNVTARMQQPHVRVFAEERDVAVWFLIDATASLAFGSGHKGKHRVAADLVGVLARLFNLRGHRVGAVVYRGESAAAGQPNLEYLPPAGGRKQVLRLLQAMSVANQKSPAQTRLDSLLRSAEKLIRQRSAVIVVSDFFSEEGWSSPLLRLAMRHDALAVRVMDPLEQSLPVLGLISLQDAETGECVDVDTHDPVFRQRYAVLAEQRESRLRAEMARAGVDSLELSTDDDLQASVLRYLRLRQQRQRVGARQMPNRQAMMKGAQA